MIEVKERFEKFPAALETFINLKVAQEQNDVSPVPRGVAFINNPSSGVRINGVELNQINKLMADLPEIDRKRIVSSFGTAPKYQVLNNLITNPKSAIRKENVSLAVKIARVITESDRIKEGLFNKAGY